MTVLLTSEPLVELLESPRIIDARYGVFFRLHPASIPSMLTGVKGIAIWCYTSQEFYQRERERIFLRTWLFAGREDQIPPGGDFMCVPTPAGSVVVLRDDQGEVRAHANSCRHRGSRLLAGIGNIRRIVCPYHGWTYGLDGRLRGAARMDSTVGFDRGALGLARCELVLGKGSSGSASMPRSRICTPTSVIYSSDSRRTVSRR